MSPPPVPDIARLIDLARYPIHDLDSPGATAMLAQRQQEFRETGACNLQGFVKPQGARELAAEAEALLSDAYRREWSVNFLYQGETDPSLQPGHPAHRFWRTGSSHIASDQFGSHSLLRQLYEWDSLTDFVAKVQGKPRLYRFADEFQALNVIALAEGERTVWHHDHNECTVTLLLQQAESGGEFVYGRDTRTEEGDIDLGAVADVIDGNPDVVKSLPRGAGTLTLFRGGCSLHGVTPVIGSRKRITAILTYDPRPGRVGTDTKNAALYGPRVQRILAKRDRLANAPDVTGQQAPG